MNKTAVLILGNQLFENHPAISRNSFPAIMIESNDLTKRYKYHKHKIILLFSAMRNYKNMLEKDGINVIYEKFNEGSAYIESLEKICKTHLFKNLIVCRPADIFFEKLLLDFSKKNDIAIDFIENPMFITPLSDLEEWFKNNSKPVLENFYRWQRKRLSILMEDDMPAGGKWNFDKENRKPLPRNESFNHIYQAQNKKIDEDLIFLLQKYFKNNPGSVDNFWIPTNHKDAEEHLKIFIHERLALFGPYEDAMSLNQPFLYHSIISPLLNCGLLTPEKVIKEVLLAFTQKNLPIASIEGFIRQIIGWREFMYGFYRFGGISKNDNYFGFTKKLEDWWYTNSDIDKNLPLPVKDCLSRAHAYGYNHHIERLMVLGNWFLLNEYDPSSVYDWFSSMYVDAYDWVMIPNVMGMSQFADGGKVATKPYICGGNYLQKMGRWWGKDNLDEMSVITKLYWQFLENNQKKLQGKGRIYFKKK